MSEPIRVLCVFAGLNRGGAETMCMNLYRNIDKTKVQFDFVKHTEQISVFEEEIRNLGGRIYTAPRFLGYNLGGYCRWWREHLEKHPEHTILHGHYFTISAIYFGIAQKQQRITVGHSHSAQPRGNGFLRIIKKICISGVEQRTDYRFACSELAGRQVFGKKGFTILKNAVDYSKFQFNETVRREVRRELGLGDEFVVGTVGSLTPVKNPRGTVSIFKEIRSRNPSAKLLWVGDGPMRGEIEQKLKEESLTDSVIMTGVRADVDRLMQAMDVFIFPSRCEGLGMAAIEAQAAGLPCLISDAVTREVSITDLCTFLPKDETERWAETAAQIDCSARGDTSEEIKKAGYDIGTTAKWLESFYLNCT